MTPKEVLIAAKAVIADEKRWIKRQLAVDSRGVAAHVGGEAAVCFCAVGAIERVAYMNPKARPNDVTQEDLASFRATLALQSVVKGLGHNAIHLFNDNVLTKHSDVMAAFDKAIEQTE